MKLIQLAEEPRDVVAKQMRYSYLLKVKNHKNQLLQSVTQLPPNSNCLTCGSCTHLLLVLDIERAHFRGFLEEIIKGQLKFVAPMISIGSNLIYEEPEKSDDSDDSDSEMHSDDLRNLFATNLVDLPGGGIHHGTVVQITDLETNEHASITLYHQSKDVLLETSEDGYIILNKEAIPAILKTKEEPEQTVKNEEESDSSDGLVESESGSEDCVEVVFPPKGVKRDGEENESNRKIIEIEWCFCLQ